MFLIERIISLFTFAFVLMAAYFMLRFTTRKQWKVVLWSYLFLLAIFAFVYQPYKTADLYRLRLYIRYWTGLPWSRIFQYALRHSTPAWVLYSYLIDKLGNTNWLQTITCLWCYGNLLYIVSHEIVRLKLSGRRRSLLLFFIMGVGTLYLETISGIRSMLGLSVVAFCFYRETAENKRIAFHIPLYLFAALVHSGSMIPVIARFLFLFVEYKSRTKRMLILLLVGLLGAFSLYYLGDFVEAAFDKGSLYLTNRSQYSYAWEILIGLIEAAQTIYVLRQFKLRFGHTAVELQYRPAYLTTLIWTVISLVLLPFSYSIFRRYTIFATMTALPLVSATLQREQAVGKRNCNYYRIIWGLSLVIFVLSCIRGDLCGYKFFVLN